MDRSHSIKVYFTIIVLVLAAFRLDAQSNVPPILEAEGNQEYCPLSQIPVVTQFDIIDPDDTGTESLHIQISSGYVIGLDELMLTGSHPGIISEWSAVEGKLSLRSESGGDAQYSDLIAAVYDVVYMSTSQNMSGTREFSFTLGDANYLPATGHFYQFVDDPGITWTNARSIAETYTYFGLQGYLVTITSAEEAQFVGEQAPGTGWIGGSDSENEGVWKWMTGPEAGLVFWNGSVDGSSPNFAFWNNGEPNDLNGEDYAHVTAPGIGIPGSWNDLADLLTNPADPYYPKGFIVEYGGLPGDPDLNISAVTQISTPEVTETVDGERCGPGSVVLEAYPDFGEILWFDTPSGGSPLGTGSTFNTAVLNLSTTYYALASVNGCENGIRVAVNATIKIVPEIESTMGDEVCYEGSGVISADAGPALVSWYDSPEGGTLLGTGNSFTTPVVSVNTTFYAEAEFDDCISLNREAVEVIVIETDPPAGPGFQSFCDLDGALISDLSVFGDNVQWYDSAEGGTPLNSNDTLQSGLYYATQSVNDCESSDRLQVEVAIWDTVELADNIPDLELCDNPDDGDDTNGFATFDLTVNAELLLNGASLSDFTIRYFLDSAYTAEIAVPNDFINTIPDIQTIYFRIENISDNSCFTDGSFEIRVKPLPDIVESFILKNCDEDGQPDGFTDFNLSEAIPFVLIGDPQDFEISFHTGQADAQSDLNPIDAVPYNNSNGNQVFLRIENTSGCYRVSTIDLQVSTTAFSDGFLEVLGSCDDDLTADGFHSFDLNLASQALLDQFPEGQNLTLHFYRTSEDAQLEENEITQSTDFVNEIPFSQILFVRVESSDNGACFGIGPHLQLQVYPRPQFEVNQQDVFCLNGQPVLIETFNPNGDFEYKWTDDSGNIISEESSALIGSGGQYTVTASSAEGCTSFPVMFNVVESGISTADLDDIIVEDLSSNNSISINTSDLGPGDYEFSLDSVDGPYQDNPVFSPVGAGDHTIYIRDKNGCGIREIPVFVLGFPKFFTPNGDGYNDSWNIKGWNESISLDSRIRIYDRYGKLIKEISPAGEGWNGTFNGAAMRASDYWFVAELIRSDGTAQLIRGHFSLVR